MNRNGERVAWWKRWGGAISSALVVYTGIAGIVAVPAAGAQDLVAIPGEADVAPDSPPTVIESPPEAPPVTVVGSSPDVPSVVTESFPEVPVAGTGSIAPGVVPALEAAPVPDVTSRGSEPQVPPVAETAPPRGEGSGVVVEPPLREIQVQRDVPVSEGHRSGVRARSPLDTAIVSVEPGRHRPAVGGHTYTAFPGSWAKSSSGRNFPLAGFGADACSNSFGDPRSGGRSHQGNDCFAPTGTPILAVEAGVIAKVGTGGLGGNSIWLQGDSGFAYYHAHNSANSVVQGQRVAQAQVIGFVGNTGNAATTPPHLHFQVHPGGMGTPAVDPNQFLIALANGQGQGKLATGSDPTLTGGVAGLELLTVSGSALPLSEMRFDASKMVINPVGKGGLASEGPRVHVDGEGPYTVEIWAGQVLRSLARGAGVPEAQVVTPEHVRAMIAFAHAEGGGIKGHLGRNNPLNTKKLDADLGGVRTGKEGGGFATVDYPTLDAGVEAAVRTIELDHYGRLRTVFLDGASSGQDVFRQLAAVDAAPGNRDWSEDDAAHLSENLQVLRQVTGDYDRYAGQVLDSSSNSGGRSGEPSRAAVIGADAVATAAAQEQPEHRNLQYDWSFGDGGHAVTTDPTVGHAYTSAGHYDVAVVVSGSEHQVGSEATSVVVSHFDAAASARLAPNKLQSAPPMHKDGLWFLHGGRNAEAGFNAGQAGDVLVPGNYRGLGYEKAVVFRPGDGSWMIEDRHLSDSLGFGVGRSYTLGQAGDIAVPGDYLGIGSDQLAVFRPADATWRILDVHGGDPVEHVPLVFGQQGDVPVPGDYLGNGQAQLALYRPADGTWHIQGLTREAKVAGAPTVFQLGERGDLPVPGRYFTGSQIQLAVFRPSTGQWIVRDIDESGNQAKEIYTPGTFGGGDDIPMPGFYDPAEPERLQIGVLKRSTGALEVFERQVPSFEKLVGSIAQKVMSDG